MGEIINWIKKLFAKANEQNNLQSVANEINAKMEEIRQSGSLDDQHYTDSVETVKKLKREGKHQDAINVLLQAGRLNRK